MEGLFDSIKESIANSQVPQNFNSRLVSFLMSKIVRPPVRKDKEPSEYNGKETHEILTPELNLSRLGYTASLKNVKNNFRLPKKTNLFLELYSRVTNLTNANCKVLIDNEEFNCHLLVLQCYSEVFESYTSIKKIELPSNRCTISSFDFIYDWMISDEPSYTNINRENVLEIFSAAKYLKIPDLIEQCWAFIDNPQVFSEETAFLLYLDAKDKDLPEVRDLMLPRIKKFFLPLVSSRNWLKLDLEDVQNFLVSNYICINCEMEIFLAAVRWLRYDWDTRYEYKVVVMSCVRFGNINPWQLIDIQRNPENSDIKNLASDPSICKMIDDGLAFVIMKFWCDQYNEDYSHWSSTLSLQSPCPRNWTGVQKIYFTYREFVIYLDKYRRKLMIENTFSIDNRLKSMRTVRSTLSNVPSFLRTPKNVRCGDIRGVRKNAVVYKKRIAL